MALALVGEVMIRLRLLGMAMRGRMREEADGGDCNEGNGGATDEPISQCEIYQIMTSQSSASKMTMTSDTNF